MHMFIAQFSLQNLNFGVLWRLQDAGAPCHQKPLDPHLGRSCSLVLGIQTKYTCHLKGPAIP